MKIYARQVAPEEQESPLMLDGCFPDSIILAGSRDYTTAEYDTIIQNFDDAALAWENSCFYWTYENKEMVKHHKKPDYSLADILRDYGFCRPSGGPWSTWERHQWRELFESGGDADDDKIMLPALKLLTGHEWESGCIRGICQGDYQDIIYRADTWSRKDLKQFETKYFNMGSEWLVSEDEGGDDCYSVYCTSWDDDGIRAEIADAAEVSPEDVVMYAFDGYSRTAQYREVC